MATRKRKKLEDGVTSGQAVLLYMLLSTRHSNLNAFLRGKGSLPGEVAPPAPKTRQDAVSLFIAYAGTVLGVDLKGKDNDIGNLFTDKGKLNPKTLEQLPVTLGYDIGSSCPCRTCEQWLGQRFVPFPKDLGD